MSKPKNKSWKSHRKNEIIRAKKDRLIKQSKSLKNNKLLYCNRWTEDDKEYLKKNHKDKTILELAIKLNRTYYSIQSKLKKLKKI